MPVEYKVFFSWTGSTTWTKQPFGQDAEEIPPLGAPVPSTDLLVMYAKSADRLFTRMRDFGGEAQFAEDTVVRYEYWESEKHVKAWSLDRNAGMGMRSGGVTKFLEGNHRIVICRGATVRTKRSIVILRAKAFLNHFPFVVSMGNVVDEIRQNAQPEKAAGTGDAVETFITDVFVPLSSLIAG